MRKKNSIKKYVNLFSNICTVHILWALCLCCELSRMFNFSIKVITVFLLFFYCINVFATDNPSLLRHVPVTVQVLDMNDNPPEVPTDEEVIVCENSRPDQVIQLKKCHVHISAFHFIFIHTCSKHFRSERLLKKNNNKEVAHQPQSFP